MIGKINLATRLVKVRRQGDLFVFINPCPFCRMFHTHGAAVAGHRQAHCPAGTPGSAGGYFLVDDGEMEAANG